MAQGSPNWQSWGQPTSEVQVLLSASIRLLADDAETTRPADLITCRKLDLQKAQSLQFAGTVQPANVNSVNSTSLDSLDESRFRIRVIAGHQHRGWERAHLPCAEGAREGGVKRLKHLRGGQRSREFCSGGALRWRVQRVEGLKIHRIGDVDDRFASELVGIVPKDLFQSRIVDSQDHDVALHRSRRVSVPNVINRGTAGSQHVSDGGAHVARAEDRDIRHVRIPFPR